MNEEEALLEAVRQNPADDTVRLAYADWLDEHGRSPQATWIRASIALHTWIPGRGEAPKPKELSSLQDDSKQARKNFDPETIRDESLAEIEVVWYRGFVASVDVEFEECLRRIPVILARHPLKFVGLNEGGDTVATLRIERGGLGANTLRQLVVVRGTARELREGEWSVELEGGDDFDDPENPVIEKWPNRAAMVGGVSAWLAPHLPRLRQ